MDSLDKLNMIRDNVAVALTLFELLVKRERKKRDMTYVVTDWQQLQMKQKHEPRAAQDAVSACGLFTSNILQPMFILHSRCFFQLLAWPQLTEVMPAL